MIKIAIVDDHTLVRKSLSLLFNSTQKIKVVVEASNGKELLDLLEKQVVDIIVLDLQMPIMDGFETAKHLSERYPKVKILILTMMNDANTIRRIIDDADGIFTKSTDPKELINAVLKLDKEGFYFEDSLAHTIQKVMTTYHTHDIVATPVNITKREIEIIQLFAKEYSGKEVASTLHIAYKTVERHKENLIKKTQSKNFMGVIIFALKHDFLKLTDIS